MQIKHYSVINPVLINYIDYYYILTTEDSQSDANYIAYPSINTPLCFLDQCKINITDEGAWVKKDQTQGLKPVIVGRFIKPVHISIESGIREFSIVFKPLGINFLLRRNLGKLIGNGLRELGEFDFLKETVSRILNDESSISALEDQLIANLHYSIELEQLQQIIDLLSAHEVISFKEITNQLNIPYKTIYRLFIRHLGLSPVHFRRVSKFDLALKKGIDPAYNGKMARIAVESGYFDQAHYINEFKKDS